MSLHILSSNSNNNVDQSKSNKQTVLDDKVLGNQFKQIEEALINLSKLLNSIQSPNSTQTSSQAPRAYHQASPSSVVFV